MYQSVDPVKTGLKPYTDGLVEKFCHRWIIYVL